MVVNYEDLRRACEAAVTAYPELGISYNCATTTFVHAVLTRLRCVEAEAWAFEKARLTVVEHFETLAAACAEWEAESPPTEPKLSLVYRDLAKFYRTRPITDVFYPWAEPRSDAYRAARVVAP